MINQAAVEAFLRRKLASYDWLKSCPPYELEAALAELEPKPDFGAVKLHPHQQAALLLLLEHQRFMLFMDMGAGKTLTCLSLLSYRKQRGEKPRAMVMVPYVTSVDTWVEEVKKHSCGLTCVPLVGTRIDNLNDLRTRGDLFVSCYATAVHMVADKEGKKLKVSAPEIRRKFAAFDTLILDEVHKCKTSSTLTYRMCRAISAQCNWVIGLTGTPFGRDLSDLWAQFHLIDFGETLGPTLGFYREAFFSKKPKFWGGFDYTFKRALLPTLKEKIKNRSISYSIDELTTLPEKEYIIKHIAAPGDVHGYAENALKAMHGADYQTIESSYLQLRQLSSGFMTVKGDENRLKVKFPSNPKLDVLQELIEGVPGGRKCVVLHHFIYSSEIISERISGMQIEHARIWGGQTDPIGELRRFRDDPKCRVLILNWRSGSSSLNLQNASYLFIYEQPDSPIDRAQGEARVWRPGQNQRVLIFDLLVRGTLDFQIMRANQNGRRLLDELLRERNNGLGVTA